MLPWGRMWIASLLMFQLRYMKEKRMPAKLESNPINQQRFSVCNHGSSVLFVRTFEPEFSHNPYHFAHCYREHEQERVFFLRSNVYIPYWIPIPVSYDWRLILLQGIRAPSIPPLSRYHTNRYTIYKECYRFNSGHKCANRLGERSLPRFEVCFACHPPTCTTLWLRLQSSTYDATYAMHRTPCNQFVRYASIVSAIELVSKAHAG